MIKYNRNQLRAHHDSDVKGNGGDNDDDEKKISIEK